MFHSRGSTRLLNLLLHGHTSYVTQKEGVFSFLHGIMTNGDSEGPEHMNHSPSSSDAHWIKYSIWLVYTSVDCSKRKKSLQPIFADTTFKGKQYQQQQNLFSFTSLVLPDGDYTGSKIHKSPPQSLSLSCSLELQFILK